MSKCDCINDRGSLAEWQPIETAPKDGTAIDLWVDGEFSHRRPGCFWGLPHHCCGEMGSYCDSEWHDLEQGWVDDFNQPLSELDRKPTHWMPLPAAPGTQPAPLTNEGGSEPIYQMRKADGSWIDQAEQSYRYNLSHGHPVRIVYTANEDGKGSEAVDMVLHCPACGMQHIDGPEDHQIPPGSVFDGSGLVWSNPPHRSHLCHGCCHIWRPADVPTNGVKAVKTKGKADSLIAQSAPLNEGGKGEGVDQLRFIRHALKLADRLPDSEIAYTLRLYLNGVHGAAPAPSAKALTDERIEQAADAIARDFLRNPKDDDRSTIATHLRALLTEQPSTEQADEDAYVIDRLSKLLAGVAIALKGDEQPLMRHSYHDLPEMAATLKLELDLYRANAEQPSEYKRDKGGA